MKHPTNHYDIIIAGGGHAGVEAAHISAVLGLKTALITLDKNAVARMSCNPAIGGLAKGQIVRELDVLGGLMPRIADLSGLQFKMLNRTKGRSVWSPRAQIDKRKYEHMVRLVLEKLPNLFVFSGEVVDIAERGSRVCGAVLRDGSTVFCRQLILTFGTFLNGLVHVGERKINAGRMGEPESVGITENLIARGFISGRLKTGTPPRVDAKTIDWSKTTPSCGDENPAPFSYLTRNFIPPNIPCHYVKTGSLCHKIIQDNFERSPLFSGDVRGAGPRYCPSIEDKVHRFSHHDSHLLFLEPEWKDSDQIYLNGFSTSLPEDVQIRSLRTVAGFERARFFRPGYAIEYDFFPPAQLHATLESKNIDGLYFAGQINGTSGYEEAAAQGLLAGINASMDIQGKQKLTLARDEAYLGVLVDDLITKDTLEPYRMFTSRAEFRLLLRYSNADKRLIKYASSLGLLSNKHLDFIGKKIDTTDSLLREFNHSVSPPEINHTLLKLNQAVINQSTPAKKVLKRPGVSIRAFPRRFFRPTIDVAIDDVFRDEIVSEVETTIKYSGYIERQKNQVHQMKKQESYAIPASLDYSSISSLSNEGREKLLFVRPETLGQAMRISGVTPADISILSVYLAKQS